MQHPLEPCLLCGVPARLQLSHVIPAFVFRWSRNTSGTGFLRYGKVPNKRVQDGVKKYWLCQDCEGRFNRVETKFATEIFHPYSSREESRFRYGPWMLRFGASVVWRVLQLYRAEKGLQTFPAEHQPHLDSAERVWREFLLGERPHPGVHQIHMLPMDVIEHTSSTQNLPPNYNRYIARMIDTDVAHSPSIAYVYAKLGRFIFLGFAMLKYPNQWVGTKLHASEGRIEPRRYVVPRPFGEYINHRARNAARISASISERQNEVINRSFVENIDRAAASDEIHAMERDVQMFGSDAFLRRKNDHGQE